MRTYFILILFIFVVACSSKDYKTEISGMISYGAGEYIQLQRYEINKSYILDSVKIKKNGKFKFKLKQKEPCFYLLNASNTNYALLLLEPGDKVRFYADYWNLGSTYDILGSEPSQQIRKLDIQMFVTKKKLDSLLLIYETNKDNIHFDSIRISLDNAYLKIIKDQRDSTIAFIINHLNSLATIYALQQKLDEQSYVLNHYRDLQYYKIVYQALSKKYPGISLIQLLEAQLKEFESYYNQWQLLNMAEKYESPVPELKLPSLKGDTISLLQMVRKNKYILLHFWASWDQASINQIPELHKAYRKYHVKGLEIYSVSLDYNKEQWQRAVIFDSLTWINVSDLNYPDSKAALIYNISRIPANYLISSKGDIIAKNLKGDRMWEHMATAFNEK